ncbi:hypothetical protein SKAU_G00426450 [Synaphobranchus kaupii]|uniref:G-protein coupled receptors family 1 profile domain-containing protein n=1 Tax=Synaphobranchus kaupii TaxID=118154 RepID=A0A9Q1E593_SYNKA|nr:hypothetical protein SKAU_G00426450 [Synaphobranchus kaupii]
MAEVRDMEEAGETLDCLLFKRRSLQRYQIATLHKAQLAVEVRDDGSVIVAPENSQQLRPKELPQSYTAATQTHFVVPSALLIYCNGGLVHTLRLHAKTQNSRLRSSRSNAALIKAQHMASFTAASFVLCWMPWVVGQAYYLGRCSPEKYAMLDMCLSVGNTYYVTNPLLYMFLSNTFHRRPSFCIYTNQSHQSHQSHLSVDSV